MLIENNKAHFAQGILFVILFSFTAFYIAETDIVKYISFSPLIVGIILGMIYGNTLRQYMPKEWSQGITFCSKKILRFAIILYGFRLTFQHVINIGLTAIMIDVIVIVTTIMLGLLLGKLLKMDKELSLLTATGSAICGAAAVLGTEPVLNNKPYKTAVAVSTVVIFGTIAMFLYPVIFRSGLLDLNTEQWAVYTGATVHEVAHVVGAGNAMGEDIASSAIIVKMIRVIFLAPVLLVYTFFISRRAAKQKDDASTGAKIMIPWFAIWFIFIIGFNSFNLLPAVVVDGINYIDTFLLTMAMTALGMETSFSKFKEAGFKPFVLAFILFIWLVLGGYAMVKYIPSLL